MRVRIINDTLFRGGHVPAGEIVSATDKEAKYLISNGKAVVLPDLEAGAADKPDKPKPKGRGRAKKKD